MKDWIAAVEADVPVLLWGPPGTGKTSAILAEATKRNAHVEVRIGSTLDPTDICRLTATASGVLRESAAPAFRRIQEALEKGQETWLFLDEFNCSPPAIQAALLRVVNERRVGDIDIRGCRILAAANEAEHAADGYDLSPAMLNRWMHLDWHVDPEEWTAGELSGWGGTPGPGSALIAGWISHNASALLRVPKAGDDVRGWPSPRAWSIAARFPDSAPLSLLSGVLGKAAAGEYYTWKSSLDLPKAEDVLSGKAQLPDRPDKRMTVLGSCTSYVIKRPKLHKNLWEIFKGLKRSDVALVSMRRALLAFQAAGVEPVADENFDKLLNLAIRKE